MITMFIIGLTCGLVVGLAIGAVHERLRWFSRARRPSAESSNPSDHAALGPLIAELSADIQRLEESQRFLTKVLSDRKTSPIQSSAGGVARMHSTANA